MAYVATYNTGNYTRIKGVEWPVLLPDQPPLSQMVNYGLPLEKQKFQKTVVPPDLEGSEGEAEFVKGEWHKRYNGLWILICGEPVYITGSAYVYFNYWYGEIGDFMEFRMEGVEWFQEMNDCEIDPNSFGMFDIKARRLGDTEKALCYGWEISTRYRKSHFGMMNKNDKDAEKNFDRVVEANLKMVYFFKPVHQGKDRPDQTLELNYPPVQGRKWQTSKRELGSKVSFEPTKKAAYDGERLRFFHGDEPGKVPVSKLDYIAQWGIVKQCLALFGGRRIVGKAALTTTIEDMDNGLLVEKMGKMWESSNQLALNKYGRTESGLKRVLRGAWLSAPVDEFGRHLSEGFLQEIQDEIDNLISAGKHDEATALRRKYPLTIEDALAIPSEDCILHPGIIDMQSSRLSTHDAIHPNYPQKAVRGNFDWTAGFASPVVWKPDPNGFWIISGHPKEPNKIVYNSGLMGPGNKYLFAGGNDPVDDHKPDKGGSKGSFVIEALPDPLKEPLEAEAFSEHPNKQHMLYGRPVCTYTNRPDNPYLFYDHALMTCIYYGCLMLVERPKTGLINYAIQKRLFLYMALRPNIDPNKAFGPQDYGAPATPENIMACERELRSYISENHEKIWHPELLKDARQYNGTNRTKRDITVAWGWARMLTQVLMNKMEHQERNSRSNTTKHASMIKRYRIPS